jgi:hypothetical protein
MKVICNLEHEIDVPDALISIADAARPSNRTMQTIHTGVRTGLPIGYTPTDADNQYRHVGRRPARTLVSKH